MSNTATFNTSPNLKLSKKLSFGEEVANSVTDRRTGKTAPPRRNAP